MNTSDQPMMSPRDFDLKLQSLQGHIERADAWADEHFRRFPNVDSVSVNFGAVFFVQFTVTVTWQRKK